MQMIDVPWHSMFSINFENPVIRSLISIYFISIDSKYLLVDLKMKTV